MNRRRLLIAAIICAVILLSIFVSSAYIVHETAHHHDCAGEGCPICQFIAQIEQLRRGFAMALMALLLIRFALAAGRKWRMWTTPEDSPTLCTLVDKKIRLND